MSYVKFLSNNELASASTDSTLRLWDVKDNVPVRFYFPLHFCGYAEFGPWYYNSFYGAFIFTEKY